jgi:hypothetical protein
MKTYTRDDWRSAERLVVSVAMFLSEILLIYLIRQRQYNGSTCILHVRVCACCVTKSYKATSSY